MTSAQKKVRKLGASYTTYKRVKGGNLEEMLRHSKTKMKTRPSKLTEEVRDLITEFYTRDDISRVFLYKNKTL